MTVLYKILEHNLHFVQNGNWRFLTLRGAFSENRKEEAKVRYVEQAAAERIGEMALPANAVLRNLCSERTQHEYCRSC